MRDMKTRLLLMIPCVIVIPWTLFAQLQTVGSVERMDPALDAIVPADARIEKLAGGFKFTEGPVWVHSGYLLFSDIPNNVINKWTPDGKVTVYLKPSGYSGPIPPSGELPGSNGLTLDRQGRLLICQHGNRRLVRVEKNGKQTVLADKYKGKRLNSPNDVVVKSDGSIYFTDPPYGLPKEDADPAKELPFNGVFRLARGKLEPLIKDLTRPNGIAFSPGEKFLYISVSDPARKVWMRYEVNPDGTVANGKVFYDVTSNKEDGLPDGMKIDQKGNVYGTGPGGVWIFSPQGKYLGRIKPPEVPANCNWGDEDGKTLYMTARTGLYRIRLNVPGIRP
ncbi:MAG TPA: SMP-30/gluconolactonase/LRE family protein [Terriglobia bacterium]|nr:SMP-30/gluconolactonase/LRE family protein [Terriglobia bacterium]